MANEYWSQDPIKRYGWQAYEGGDYYNPNQSFLDQKGSVEAIPGKPAAGMDKAGKPGQTGLRKSAYMDWSPEQWQDWANKQFAGAQGAYESMVGAGVMAVLEMHAEATIIPMEPLAARVVAEQRPPIPVRLPVRPCLISILVGSPWTFRSTSHRQRTIM
jgi:hypothetical protein